MSRCTIKVNKPGFEVIVGLDRMLGHYFGQAWDTTKEHEEPADEFPAEPWRPGSKGELLDWLERYGPDLTDKYTHDVYSQIALDLDPGDVERKG